MKEGERRKQIESMQEDIEDMQKELSVLKGCQHESDLDVEGMKKDIEYIKASVDEIKKILRDKP